MNLGVITFIVAVTFSILGIIAGFFIGKLSCGEKKRTTVLEGAKVDREVSNLSSKVGTLVDEVNDKLTKLSKETVSETEKKINEVGRELENLQGDLTKLNLSKGSVQALGNAIEALKSLNFSLPSVDESLLTQIKDSLAIIRTDIQSLKMKKEEKRAEIPELHSLMDSLNSAINLAKEFNTVTVKDELLTLANLLNHKDKDELLKDLDRQALTSKELVMVLSGLKKEIEGVRK